MYYHLAICVDTRYGRAGFVLSGTNRSKILNWADKTPNRIGYVLETDFALAVKRAGMMERNEPGAWGPLS